MHFMLQCKTKMFWRVAVVFWNNSDIKNRSNVIIKSSSKRIFVQLSTASA